MKRSRIALDVPKELKDRIENAASKRYLAITAYIVLAVVDKLATDEKGLKPTKRKSGQPLDERCMLMAMNDILVLPDFVALPEERQAHIIEQWIKTNGHYTPV